jgi:hypothetical protein
MQRSAFDALRPDAAFDPNSRAFYQVEAWARRWPYNDPHRLSSTIIDAQEECVHTTARQAADFYGADGLEPIPIARGRNRGILLNLPMLPT